MSVTQASHPRPGASALAARGARLAVALWGLGVGAGCSSDPSQASFSQDVGNAFAPCNPAEIRFLASKHNFMTAFENCGSNNFATFAWSPDGQHLYFQLPLAAYVMDAEAQDKRTVPVPTQTPVGPAAWLNASRVAVPVGPAPGEEAGGLRLAIFDVDQKSIDHRALTGFTEVTDVQVGDSPSELLFVGTQADQRSVFRLDLDSGTLTRAFPWLDRPFTTFSYAPSLQAVVLGHEGKVSLHKRDGTELGAWSPASRGALHGDGRWLALEHDGQAVSIFHQRHWDELSEQARARELARSQRFQERLPDWYPKEVQPPTLSVVDLSKGERWVFTGFFGSDFQWYDPYPMQGGAAPERLEYGSFILWGFEGKELNRNVVLGNLADRLRSIDRGQEMMGLQRWAEATDAPASVPGVLPVVVRASASPPASDSPDEAATAPAASLAPAPPAAP